VASGILGCLITGVCFRIIVVKYLDLHVVGIGNKPLSILPVYDSFESVLLSDYR